MLRKIIKIDAERCNGCGLCTEACHEGAIGMVDGKAALLRDDFCDGLGDCLPFCPTGAIRFEAREAKAYDETKVMQMRMAQMPPPSFPCSCPGAQARALAHADAPQDAQAAPPVQARTSRLRQWPVQIKLAPVQAPYFDGAKLLFAADCAAYAYSSFHEDFIKGSVVLIGCPKLDEGDYTEKITEILRCNDIQSVTVVRMEVPCCGGIMRAVKNALQNCGKMLPWQIVALTVDGHIIT